MIRQKHKEIDTSSLYIKICQNYDLTVIDVHKIITMKCTRDWLPLTVQKPIWVLHFSHQKLQPEDLIFWSTCLSFNRLVIHLPMKYSSSSTIPYNGYIIFSKTIIIDLFNHESSWFWLQEILNSRELRLVRPNLHMKLRQNVSWALLIVPMLLTKSFCRQLW